MVYKPMSIRLLAITLSLLTIVVTAPFSIAETVAAPPMGTVATGSVTVGSAAAPTGTTIFAGDKVISNEPALLTINGGSRIELTKAEAAITRRGDTLVVGANRGLLRFNFKKGERVQIDAGKFQFTGVNDNSHIGELGLNVAGEIAMNMSEGTFIALNTETGARTEVAPNNPMVVTDENDSAAAAMQISTAEKVLIIAGIAGGAANVGFIIHENVKSPSSR